MTQFRNVVIILAAGEGTRYLTEIPKQYSEISGKTMLGHSLGTVLSASEVEMLVLVTSPEHGSYIAEAAIPQLSDERVRLVPGGKSRGESIKRAFEWCQLHLDDLSSIRFIVHDSCRPFLSEKLFEEVMRAGSSQDAWVTFQTSGDTHALRSGDQVELIRPDVEVLALNTPIALFESTALRIAASDPSEYGFGLAGFLLNQKLSVGYIRSDGSTKKITYPHDVTR